MKKIIISLLCAIMVLPLAAKDYKYTTVPGDPMQARIYTLDNGLKVYLSVNNEKPRITAYIAVNTGHRNDPADCTGLAHYLEHLMFKGSHKLGTSNYEAEAPLIQKISDLYEEYRTLTDPQERKAKYHEIDSVSQIAAQYNIPNEYDKIMAAIGSNGTNAHTWFDETIYKEDIPANEVQRWAEIQADRFQNLVLRGFHTELEAVYEEKNISLSNDGEKAFDAALAKLFPSHSYGTQTTIGTQDHLKNPSLVAITNYWNKYYRPNNVAICMAGDMNPDEVIAILDKQFGGWEAGKDISPRKFPKQPIFTEPQDTTVVGQEQEAAILAWRFDGSASLQNDTLQVLSGIMSNGRAGLIDLNINQQMKMQGAGSESLNLKEYSIFILEGAPKDGQSLDEVRALLLGEVKKLKEGDFDEELIESYVNNKKRMYLSQMDSNGARVQTMYNAFINGKSWEYVVGQIDRMKKITKADIVAFANKYLTDGYVCSYKKKGEDNSIKKIEKPEITPIPTNRDKTSTYLAEMTARKTGDIQPRFINFDTDLTKSQTKTKLPLIYLQNKENDLFTMAFRYEFGDRADVRYSTAKDYLSLLGTDKYTNEQLKKMFYKMACDYNISVGNQGTTVVLSGLNENMPKALALMEHIFANAKVDKDLYKAMVEQELKERAEQKQDQKTCFNYLSAYAQYGPQNDYTNIMSETELRNTDPQVYVDLIKNLKNYKHTLLYYGPSTEKELSAIIAKNHKTAKKLLDVPANKEFKMQTTPQSEVLIAPYKANNIYMRMFNCEGKTLDISRMPVISLFNEYFGGGMNAIVFQELRESRGLAYNAYSQYVVPGRKDGNEFWMEHIISQNDKMMDCINTFNEITDNMPQAENAFNVAKTMLIKTLAAQRTTKFGIINAYLAAQLRGVDYDLNKVLYDAIPSLKLKDILNFEQQNIKGKPMRYYILGDEKELDIPALEKIAPVKRVSLEDIFGY